MLTKPVYWLVTTDFLLRIALLAMYLFYFCSDIVFVIVNMLLTAGNILTSYVWDKKIERIIPGKIHADYSGHFSNFESTNNSETTIRSVYLITGLIATAFVFFHIQKLHHWTDYLSLGGFLVMGLCVSLHAGWTMGGLSAVKPIHSYKVYRYKSRLRMREVTGFYPNAIPLDDEGVHVELPEDLDDDLKIGKLEGELKSITGQVDGYLLESVFLGGLAFSALIALVVSNYGSNESQKFSKILHCFSDLRGQGIYHPGQFINHLIKETDLSSLIMIECLICAVFFLLVLTLRIRFSHLALKMDYLVRILISFNSKQEELINLSLGLQQDYEGRLGDRQKKVTTKINATLDDTNKLLKQINPILRIMSMYRNSGIICFYMILVSCGLYFSAGVSFIILLLAIFSYGYRYLETKTKVHTIQRILTRH